MADLRYNVDIDTKGAQASLRSLKSSIGGIASALGVAFGAQQLVQISARFEDLRTTLSFLFGDVREGAKVFSQIKEFAQQSVFSVEDLTNTVVKLKSAGLEPTIEQLRLFADVSSVATDSVGALQAITDLFARTTEGGLGLEDLNRLADRGIPVFKILGDTLNLSRLEISKFGQSAEGAQIILGALTQGLQEMFGGASAARASNLSQAFSNFEDAVANLADTLGQGGLNKALTDVVNSMTTFIEENQKLIEAIGYGLGEAIKFAVGSLKTLGIVLAGVFAVKSVATVLALAKGIREVAEATKKAAIAGAVLQGVTGVGLLKIAAGLAGVAGVIASIEAYTSDTSDGIKKLEDDIKGLSETTANAQSTGYLETFNKLKDKQEEIAKSSLNYFQQYKDSVDDVRTKVKFEQELVGLSEQQVNVQRALNDFTQKYYDTIRPLQQKVIELKAKDTEESKIQAAELEKQIAKISEYHNSNLSGLEQELNLKEQLRQQEETRLILLNNRRDLEESLEDTLRESRRNLEDLSLTPFQRELEGIKRALDDELGQSIRNIRSQWENGLITNDAYLKEIDELERIASAKLEVLTENAKKQRQIQRSFTYGWKEAFESYRENATNAARAAERIFERTTKGMEDAIVNFAKTGKFEFRSFIADILETMLRSQVQQAIANIFGIFGGGGRGGISNLFAGFFANGGMIPAGSFGVVGERGPELVTGPATVTPMNGMGGNVTYNINAVDAPSFQQLVARDPGFIHAVASQGASSIPRRR